MRTPSRYSLGLLSLGLLTGCAGDSSSATESPIAVVQAPAVVQVTPVGSVDPASITQAGVKPIDSTCSKRIGVNIAGAEFGSIGDQYGFGYIYPDTTTLDYFRQKHITLIRLPIRWERIQPKLGSELDPAEVDRINKLLDQASARGIDVVIDLHNYGRYGKAALGSNDLPVDRLADFWERFSSTFAGRPGMYGYGLMNEPHDMPSRTAWPDAAQAAVKAIRKIDPKTLIYIAGDDWSSADHWQQSNKNLMIDDPSNNFIYEAHVYFDKNASGTYTNGYASDGTYPDIGVDRLKSFSDFLTSSKSRGFIGEYGIPSGDIRYLDVMDRFLHAASSAGIETAYFAAGQWWGSYPLSIQPDNGRDKPQMSVLEKYIGDGNLGCNKSSSS